MVRPWLPKNGLKRDFLVNSQLMRVLFGKKNWAKALSVDEKMNKIQERLFQALGPLSAAWLEMQKGIQDDLEEGSETNPELVLEHLNNTIVLIGQTINKVSY